MTFATTSTEFDATKARAKTGYTCQRRVEMVVEGRVIMRNCDRCPRCLAKRKADRAGRGAAQVAVSQQVAWITLTYADYTPEGREGARRFVPKHRSDLLKRLRMREWRAARKRLAIPKKAPQGKGTEAYARISAGAAQIVYTGCGETGTRGTKRKHWHLLLFYDRPSQLIASAKNAKGHAMAEERDWWPHGKVTVELFDPRTEPSAVYARVRYIQKYVEKNRGVDPELRKKGLQDCCFFASQGKAYGASFMEQEARRTAQAGLPYHGRYIVPGLGFSRGGGNAGRDRQGRKLIVGAFIRTGDPALDAMLRAQYQAMQKPQDRWNTVQGACRKYAIKAYKDEWQRLRPGVPIPRTQFLEQNDPEYVAEDYTRGSKLPFRWKEHGALRVPLWPLAPKTDPARCGVLLVAVGRQHVGSVTVYASGAARFVPDPDGLRAIGQSSDGRSVWLPSGTLQTQLPFLGQKDRETVELWLWQRRGDNWLSPAARKVEVARRLKAEQELFAERDAALLCFAKSEEAATHKDGTGYRPFSALWRQMQTRGKGHHGAWRAHRRGEKLGYKVTGLRTGFLGRAP